MPLSPPAFSCPVDPGEECVSFVKAIPLYLLQLSLNTSAAKDCIPRNCSVPGWKKECDNRQKNSVVLSPRTVNVQSHGRCEDVAGVKDFRKQSQIIPGDEVESCKSVTGGKLSWLCLGQLEEKEKHRA